MQCVSSAILLLDQSVQCHAGHYEASGSPQQEEANNSHPALRYQCSAPLTPLTFLDAALAALKGQVSAQCSLYWRLSQRRPPDADIKHEVQCDELQ